MEDYRIHCYIPIQWNILKPFIFRVDDFYMKSLFLICPHTENAQDQA